MGRRARRRAREQGSEAPIATSDYSDADGNVLTLRDRLSARTEARLAEPGGGAAASHEDRWQRHTEMLFERYAVRWTIAGLPLDSQKELLERFRMADSGTRRWIRETIDRHREANSDS
jgi:hypothetical protein